jgi:cytochrome c-type biogenesis protein CcmE
VVIGKYENEVFNASQVLVKCPSKYDDQAADRWESYSDDGKEASDTPASDVQATDTP